jgi:hypothetical protein
MLSSPTTSFQSTSASLPNCFVRSSGGSALASPDTSTRVSYGAVMVVGDAIIGHGRRPDGREWTLFDDVGHDLARRHGVRLSRSAMRPMAP